MSPKHKTLLISMSVREGNRKFFNFSIDSISLQNFFYALQDIFQS